jgi:hypothetical protein
VPDVRAVTGVSGKSTLKNFKAMLAEAKLPEATVMICLRGDLAADHESAERELEEAEKRGADSLAGSGAGVIVDRIEALEAEMREHTYEFRLRALPRPAWREMLAAHPPRRNDDGELIEPDKSVGVDTTTFTDAVLRACLVDPELNDAEFEQLVNTLTDRQYDELSDAAWGVNRKDVSVPFSRAASRMKRASADESSSPTA